MQSGSDEWPPCPSTRETDSERTLRLEEEREAKRISDDIDRAIERDYLERRKKRAMVKVLLLGQAESGKSTMLKNFQIHFAPTAFNKETVAWRAVIHLNLVRSVNFILNMFSQSSNADSEPVPPSPTLSKPKDELRWWKMHLAPLRQVEAILLKCLTGKDTTYTSPTDEEPKWDLDRASEVSVRCGTEWKALVQDYGQHRLSRLRRGLDDARQILDACRENIISLWTNSIVQESLQKKGIELRSQPGFFLDEVDRIASISYEPTAEDVLRARLRTIGVEEHCLMLETKFEHGQEWIFYDVDGSRGQRAAWIPYFYDVNAMIYVCPMAGFDQKLAEDGSVNRLIDSWKLWELVCSNKLLEETNFIVLLNKRDTLHTKLDSGILFSSFICEYEMANDAESVILYIKRLFKKIHKDSSPSTAKRQLRIHCTCAIDLNMMSQVLAEIRDFIITNALESSHLL